MKTVSINRDACISCAACWLLCPELFIEEKKDLKSSIRPPHRVEGQLAKGMVPLDQEAYADEAADACPVHVITLR
jgi:ferredoxin